VRFKRRVTTKLFSLKEPPKANAIKQNCLYT